MVKTSAYGCVQVSVAHMLQAYQKVLPRHGIIAAEDTYYYRMVITLSLRPEADWWDKLQAESSLWHGAQNPLQPQISRCRAAATTPAPQLSGSPGPVEAADAGSAKQPGQRREPAPADAWQEMADEFLRRSAVRGPLLRSRSASPQRLRPAPEPYQRYDPFLSCSTISPVKAQTRDSPISAVKMPIECRSGL